MTEITPAGRDPNVRVPITRDAAGRVQLDFARLLQRTPAVALTPPLQPFAKAERIVQSPGLPTSPALMPFDPMKDDLPAQVLARSAPVTLPLQPVAPAEASVAMAAAETIATDLATAAIAITGSVGALTFEVYRPDASIVAGDRATSRARIGGDVQALAVLTPHGDVPVVFAGPAPAVALLQQVASTGAMPGLRLLPGASSPAVLHGMGIIPADPVIRPVATANHAAAQAEATGAATVIAQGVLAMNGSSTPLTSQALHPWAFTDAKAQEKAIEDGGGHATAAIVATTHGDVPVLFSGSANDVDRLYQQLMFGDHPGAQLHAGREGSRYNEKIDVRPFTSNPLPKVEDFKKACSFMFNRFKGTVEADAVVMPALARAAILTGTGRPLPAAEHFKPHLDTPILNTLNAALASKPVRAMLGRAGVSIEIPEALVRFSHTTPRSQNKQAWELDPLFSVLTIGVSHLAHFASRGDLQGVRDAASFIGHGLSNLSDAVLRPGRSTFTEEAQSSFITKFQEGLEPLGVPFVTKSTFFELSLDRNLNSSGGTGFLTYDRARDSFMPRVERNPNTDKIVLMRDAVVKSFWQGQAAYALPREHENPLVGTLPHPIVDAVLMTAAMAVAPLTGPGAFAVATAAAPAVKLVTDTVVRGGVYGLAEARVIDYGPNKGYLTLPAGTEISERVLSLIMEAILDPAAFSEAGRNSDDVRLLARTFDTMAIHPFFDLKNRGDNVLELVKANRDNTPDLARGLRFDGDVKAEIIWNPFARREAPLPAGITLPVIDGTMPLTWLNGFNPFGILQSMSIGLVVKVNVFPSMPDTYRSALLDGAGKVLEQHIHDPSKDGRPKNFTQLNIQATGPGATDGVVGLRLQNAVARAITGTGTRPDAPLQAWTHGAAASVRTMLMDLDASGDPAVSKVVTKAIFTFHHAPATGLVTGAQREAIRDVLMVEAARLARQAPPSIGPAG